MGQGGFEGGDGETGSGLAEFGVQLVGSELEELRGVLRGKLPGFDAGVAAQDGREHEARAAAEGQIRGAGCLQKGEAIALRKRGGRVGCGEGVEIHGQCSTR